jgi:putative transposase
MGMKRHKPEEIVTMSRQVEVLCGQGMPRVDAIHQVQIAEQTFYRWRKQYGGMGTEQLRELKWVVSCVDVYGPRHIATDLIGLVQDHDC